jgi:hypothetical protein
MARVPYLDSDKLVASVRRRCSLPKSDSLYSDDDILEFANDELMDSVLPDIKGMHEEYFVWNTIVDIQDNTSKYNIPERALGNSLRDISFIDSQGNEYEMTRIMRDDRYTTQFPSTYSQPYRFYVENDKVVIVPDVRDNASGQLKMTFLLRPNQLVLSENVAKINSIDPDFAAISTITNGTVTTITTSSAHFLSDNESISLSSVTGVDAALLNGTHTATVVNDVTFTIPVDTSAAAALTGGLVDNNTTKIICVDLPETISGYVDFLKTKSPHSTLGYDIEVKKFVYIANSFTIKDADVPTELQRGDTVANVYETDIPGIPTEYHRHLVSKVCERVMEGLGDQAGLAAAAKKTRESENSMSKISENRVTSAPLKVKNTSGFLNRKYRRTRRF